MINELSLFSGYGGLTLGLRLAQINVRTVAYVEWEPYCQEIIKARIRDQREGRFGLDDAPIFSDISSFRGEQFRGVVDIITAGFPCQPHSVAGLQRGDTDERNKWPDTLRVIREVEPRWVILENVPGLLSSSSDGGTPAYGGTVTGELAQVGYSVHWQTIGADDVGAPHRRKRWFCIAELADSDGQRGRCWDTTGQYAEDVGQPSTFEGDYPKWPPGPSDTDRWERILGERPDLQPALTKDSLTAICGVADGATHRVDRLKACGNGVLPSVVAAFLRGLR